ncbi:baseplate J/gp47 family protein [Aquimarina mytili]|uniref:Baseplate protein J-like domain-containing protein n=1 Tax=Aquimarina mytili TaxID=874423 RepID=A0A936ZXN8_9FLAO|nr:hypothetical protein [Aquimarina mytili]MBL0683843.1 hypothetical protein [Aquimarina mytili]
MKNPSNIAHPLKNRTGTSQRNRVLQALGTDSALIDGKTMADRLFLISEYAKHVNFYQYVKTEINGESQELDNWSVFFNDSLPFKLAILSKTSIDELEAQFLFLYEELKANPSKQSLESLFNFIENKIISPTTQLFNTVESEQNSFTDSLLAIIKTSFSDALKSFICLYNSSVNFLCITKKNFSGFINSPWQLKVEEIYALDLCLKQVQKGKKEAFLKAGEVLNTIFRQVLSGLQEIVSVVPDYIAESLMPLKESLQKKHQPHIALLFTFLEVFKHFQGNINELNKKHLDFFYEQVLKLVPKDAIPDKAHIVFELANHKKQYALSKDLLLKDGKDGNNQDIQFGLDHEIIIDKAQVKDLKTLSLYPTKLNGVRRIEGVYIAPKANAADGVDKEFKEDQPTNWPTLGSKYSKYIKEGNEEVEEYPRARLGFILSSPVLLLEEGKRIVEIRLNCNLANNGFTAAQIKSNLDQIALQKVFSFSKEAVNQCPEISDETRKYLLDILGDKDKYYIEGSLKDFLTQKDPISCEPFLDDNQKSYLCNCEVFVEETSPDVSQLFVISFSGEEEWVIPKQDNIESVQINLPAFTELNTEGDIQFMFRITLDDDDPKVVFFNEEKLKEKIKLDIPFPLVKIELNSKVKKKFNVFTCDEIVGGPVILDENDRIGCCLKKDENPQEEKEISPYNFLKGLVLTDAKIDIEVCGVKNIIVQNDENLQDVSKPMFPFGPRPKVDASFFIGSKEVFCKDWESFRVGVEWKDRPQDFADYYEAYNLEDGVNIDSDDVFKMEASVLDDALWKKDNVLKNIFTTKESFLSCPPIDPLFNFNGYTWDRSDFPLNTYQEKSMPIDPLSPLTVNSRKAFFRMRLKGEDFQHDQYAFVLAKQVMALANIISPEAAARVRDDLRLLGLLGDQALVLLGTILGNVDLVNSSIIALDNTEIPNLLNLANSIQQDLNDVNNDYNDAASPGKVLTALGNINLMLVELDPLLNASSIIDQVDLIRTRLNLIKGFIEDNPGLPFFPNSIPDSVINDNPLLPNYGLLIILVDIKRRIERVTQLLDVQEEAKLPNEPYTPQIKSIFVDYKAKAEIEDMDIVHLYPFEDTSKQENIVNEPTLFPYFDDEGTLFIGIEKITIGGSLSMLFQLAEATADSELDRATINWYYLSNNEWKPLEFDFKVISDTTDGFTVSGITTIIVPEDISNEGNTVMPDPLYWIKATAPKDVKAVAETIGIHTQAARSSARITELNDKNRLEEALEEGSIAKLVEADFNVKKVEQLYPSFGGRTPEANGHFYTRVSEHLKHKGRALMLADYEKIVLEGFHEIYKAKCITHTMGLSAIDYKRDLEIAPGYVVVTVIPDLTKLKSGNLQEPKVPVSLLEKIGDHIRKRTSPFARLKVMNPRFEYVDVSITIRLNRGKSPDFYKKKLKEDISLFLAPWSLGDSEKLAFGQVVLFSDIVGFVEQLEYVDFIVSLNLKGECDQTGSIIKPLTARSVLTAGEICVKDDKEECPKNGTIQRPEINQLYQSM